MDTVISCSNCAVSSRESENIVRKCSLCDRNYCGNCVESDWRDLKWVEVCRVCSSIEYLQQQGLIINEKKAI